MVLERAGYVADDGVAPWGRAEHPVLALASPAGSAVVAKLYPQGDGRATYDNMVALRASSFATRWDPPRLPRALTYLDDIGALVMERVEGRPLDHRGLADGRSVRAAMETLVALHSSDARPTRRRTPQGVVRSLRRGGERAGTIAPALTGTFQSVVEALEAARPRAVERVPSHGDFCARNLLVCSDRIVVIDWDRFGWADPARDVASFGAWSWGRAVRDGRTPDWCVLEAATSAYSRQLPAAAIEERVAFYAAAALVRVAHILVTRPRQVAHVTRFLDEALRLVR